MHSIPQKHRDLRRLTAKRIILRIAGYLFWILLWYSGADVYNQNHMTYPPERRMVGWRLAIWMSIAMLTGILLFRMWKLITDRTLCGVIEYSGLSHGYTPSEDKSLLQGGNYDFRLHTVLVIRTPNGKRRRIRFEQKNGFYLYYHEGNEILRFRGLPYPLNTDPNAENGHVCSMCGFWSKDRIEHCPACYYSVISPDEISKDQP